MAVVAVYESDPANLGAVTGILRSAHYEVVTLETGTLSLGLLRGCEFDAAVVFLRHRGDVSRLTELRSRTPAILAVLKDAPSAFDYIEALRRGATGAIPASVRDRTLLAALQATVCRLVTLPVDVAAALCQDGGPGQVGHVSEAERWWLQELRAGKRIGELASTCGWSARTMHRKLHEVYRRLGVASMQEAVTEAQRRGLL